MKAYENVYKLENAVPIQNTENKIEYVTASGKRRIKTNPTLNDFISVGIYPLAPEAKEALENGDDVKFIVRNDKIYPMDKEVIR